MNMCAVRTVKDAANSPSTHSDYETNLAKI